MNRVVLLSLYWSYSDFQTRSSRRRKRFTHIQISSQISSFLVYNYLPICHFVKGNYYVDSLHCLVLSQLKSVGILTPCLFWVVFLNTSSYASLLGVLVIQWVLAQGKESQQRLGNTAWSHLSTASMTSFNLWQNRKKQISVDFCPAILIKIIIIIIIMIIIIILITYNKK